MTSKKATITVGADPEMFLERKALGTLVSSIGFIGGSKREPIPLGNRPGFFVQEDNVAVEFNIPPAFNVQEFVDSISWSVKTITDDVQKYGYRPRITAAEIFPISELKDPRAHHFGCDPDYNAWKNGQRNPRPMNVDPNLRSCGGHIHVGVNRELNISNLIKAMDFLLGVPSVLMDDDLMRRRLYGKAGCYRTANHSQTAWEYRTLSNFWLKSSETMEWAYQETIKAVNLVMNLDRPRKGRQTTEFDELMESYDLGDDIQEAINEGNYNIAHKLVVAHNLVVV